MAAPAARKAGANLAYDCYIDVMAHAFPITSPSKLVRDKRTGRTVEVRGAGALKGKLSIQRGIDLTKPIFAQVSKTPAKTTPKPHKG